MARKVTATERVYSDLKALLLAGEFADGEFLVETSLAERLSASRTPVRDAISRLATERLVVFSPGRGAYVPPITETFIRDVMSLRSLIETFAVVVARSPNSELVARLNDLVDLQAEEDNIEKFLLLDREFHQVIVDSAGNQLMSEVYGQMRDHQMRIGLRAINSEGHRRGLVIAEHKNILSGLVSGESKKTAAATWTHLRNTAAALGADLRFSTIDLETTLQGVWGGLARSSSNG